MIDPQMRRIVERATGEISTRRGSAILLLVLTAGVTLVSEVSTVRIIGGLLLLATALGALALSGELRATRQREKALPTTTSSRQAQPANGTRDGGYSEARDRLLTAAGFLGLSTPAESQGPSHTEFEPLVSIIIPVFNDARYIESSLESVRRQTYRRWECIVVDDASTDSSWDRIRSSTADDARFRTLRNNTNAGPGAARNRAITEARGEFMVFLDGDDLLLRESLADRIEALATGLDDPYVDRVVLRCPLQS